MKRTRKRAREKRRSLAPQLEAYAELGRRRRWVPYLMFSHASHFRSDVVNTDCHGFRWTILPDGTIASVESPPKEPCGVLTGGSTAFGVGATTDGKTVASLLSARSGRPWLNLAGRAHSSTQELLTFMLYADALPAVSHIVLMSGVNDLYMQYAANRFDDHIGACLYSDFYVDAMAKARRSLTRRLRVALKERGSGEPRRPFETLLARRGERREAVLALLRRNLSHWSALAAKRSARVLFALQPTFSWVGKKASSAEGALFEAREAQDPRRELMVETALSPANREWYAAVLERMCDELGFGFIDLNRALRRTANEDDWLFVDRAHLTDRGYALCAERLAAALE